MFKKIVPLQKEIHGDLKLKTESNFVFAAEVNLAAVMANEFVRAASDYPIVFVENKEKDDFIPMAMLGLEQGENLFVDENGLWEAAYIPAVIRRYPFTLAKTEEDGRFTVCMDEECDFLTREEDGRPLFKKDGEPAETLDNVRKYLAQLQQWEQTTWKFCRILKENNMLSPLNLQVRTDGTAQNITGAYAVNEKRLSGLSDGKFLEWRKQNYLAPIYSHLTSLSSIDRLVRLRRKKS